MVPESFAACHGQPCARQAMDASKIEALTPGKHTRLEWWLSNKFALSLWTSPRICGHGQGTIARAPSTALKDKIRYVCSMRERFACVTALL